MSVTLALLHLDPRPGELERNRAAIENAVRRASALGSRFIVTPELAVSGYGFRDAIGTEWIMESQARRWEWAAGLARAASVFLVLGTPEAATSGVALYNSLMVFAPDGGQVGRHRKINALRTGSESWSTPGDQPTVADVPGIGRFGLFICADMYSKRLVDETAAQGVDLLLSSAAWAPGLHGPNGEWERASAATGRPVLVCNRTGVDVVDFTRARSIAAIDGSITHCHESVDSAIILVDWNQQNRELTKWRVLE
jgi:predicted amidohydrolase